MAEVAYMLEDDGNLSADNTTETAEKRVYGRPWQPGQSGNPGGRPKKLAAVREKALDSAEEAVDILISIMRDSNARDSDRKAAAAELLDRGIGKASQEMLIGGNGIPLELMPAQPSIDFSSLSESERALLSSILQKALPAQMQLPE